MPVPVSLPANAPTTPPALLDVRAVAAMLDCSQRHVYRLADAGRLPSPVKLGSLVRWQQSKLQAWLDAGCLDCRVCEKGGK